MKKALLALVLAVAMIINILAMASCGPNKGGNGGNVDGSQGYDGSAVTIVFYHTMSATNLQPVLEDAIERFNALYPNITIDHKQIGDYDAVRDQIKNELTVGAQPNIAYCYPDHVAMFKTSKKVIVLDNLINSTATVTRADGTTETIGYTQAQLDDFIQAYLNEGRAFGDDKLYSLPISKSTEVLYYNKTFFEQHNLTVPTTWDEMAQVCEQIKAIDPTCIPLGYDSESNWFITMCEQYGSDYTSATGENFLFNNETNRSFVNMFRTWYEKKWVTTEALSGGYTSNLFTGKSSSSTDSKVPAGTRCYMCIGSTGGASYQQPTLTNGVPEFEVGIVSIPQVNPEAPKVISQGPSVCIFKKDNPQEVLATWLFAKFLTTNHSFQAAMSMTNGYAPVIKSVSENEVYSEFLASASTIGIQAYAVKVALEQEKAYYSSPAFNGSSVAREQVGLLIQKCFTINEGKILTDEDLKKIFQEYVDECKYQSGL